MALSESQTDSPGQLKRLKDSKKIREQAANIV